MYSTIKPKIFAFGHFFYSILEYEFSKKKITTYIRVLDKQINQVDKYSYSSHLMIDS